MSGQTRSDRSSIVVVGAGAAGTLTAVQLLDEAGRRHRKLTIRLVDPRSTTGRGVAYSTDDDRHLLNVPARKMSAYPDDPDHFLRWLEADRPEPVDPCGFVSRGRYGRYLGDLLDDALRRTPWATLERVHDRVVAMSHEAGRCRVALRSGRELPADAVVLAMGHLGPALAWAPPALRRSPRFISDPWLSGALDLVPDDGDVLLVGTGLTMVDALIALDRPGRRVHVTSRHGQLPHRHTPGELPVMEAPEFSGAAPSLGELHEVMGRHIAKATARYGDWRPAVDSIRPLTQRLWAGLSEEDRAEFLALDARAWDAARHRVPPASAEVMAEVRSAGRLVVHTGRVDHVVDLSDTVQVSLTDGSRLAVAAVVNCTGPCAEPERSDDPLVRSLCESGIALPGPMGLGFATTEEGRLRGVGGDAVAPIWTLGSLRKGELWESTAMPEIREQAAALARCVLGRPGSRDRRPRDAYGLPLSTSEPAAVAWGRALDAVRLLQDGAVAALVDAVNADPGFAMAHAALALLGHEWGLAVDVEGARRRAVEAVARRGDARERSFVHAVATRLGGPVEVADGRLRRHLEDHPLDAFAVSVALPTIAFGGLAQPVERSWALVDRLAPAYGDDWWFTGVRAFFRQEQSRWDEAAALAAASMAAEPASGHAAHARAHVCYETGEHRAGIDWLDGWITEHGARLTHRAHYAWHAAMHELALDDASAVRRRYAEQLAPPAVTGARALVDSASLLWRSWLVGCWDGELPITPVLASVPDCLLDRPTTAFAALHAAVALAAAGDDIGIERLGRYAAGHPEPVFAEVIAPICVGFAAQARGEPERAVAALTPVIAHVHRLGGSAAQQEVVEETLLHALVEAGRRPQAVEVLRRRLDRRPSRSDRRRLLEFAGSPASPPARP